MPQTSRNGNDEMKRSIHDTQIEPPEPLFASTMSMSTVQRAQPKEFRDSCLSTEGYWKEKASNLQNAFAAGSDMNGQPQQQMNTLSDQSNHGSEDLPRPRPMVLNLSTTRPNIPAIQIQIPSPSTNPITPNTKPSSKPITNPPLSGNAISHILQHTKPDCPKAQTWITAQRISEETKQCLAQRIGCLGVTERGILERKIAARLAEKARQQGGVGLVQGQEQNQGKRVEEWVEGNLTAQQRVKRANVRLQRAVGLE
ncbi:uncharacterized protein ASPGLDRAFT_35057 [Aspergillus glaucus CBS 516.65]|uniref:Uncharacterized protein n=1 Tax=Aspergillus glaucus CBS 516.65 TaxID=1160497 RepID=A0A1L9VKV8_ASPGL|nr:hypothetical protein ASPGLDRAFT_35057 [Aspergillus glaucus CBS 516.65]OJJ84557.1 hypothetical protein ASPGLDRAFT_35057 [Aspergillus glaucus CBS 516.65]